MSYIDYNPSEITRLPAPVKRHVVFVEKSAKVRGAAKQYPYSYCAVIEMEEPDTYPAMISNRARGVRRILWVSGTYPSRSSSPWSQGGQARATGHALIDKINSAGAISEADLRTFIAALPSQGFD